MQERSRSSLPRTQRPAKKHIDHRQTETLDLRKRNRISSFEDETRKIWRPAKWRIMFWHLCKLEKRLRAAGSQDERKWKKEKLTADGLELIELLSAARKQRLKPRPARCRESAARRREHAFESLQSVGGVIPMDAPNLM